LQAIDPTANSATIFGPGGLRKSRVDSGENRPFAKLKDLSRCLIAEANFTGPFNVSKEAFSCEIMRLNPRL
jgi:hypothetical protein